MPHPVHQYWQTALQCVLLKISSKFRIFVIPLLGHFYSETNTMHHGIKCILFWNDTLHVSDGLSIHHQQFKSVHTATGICQTDTAVCLLAGRQQCHSKLK